MRVEDHIGLSAGMAIIALPLLKRRAWIPFASSVLIDVDHYLWFAVTHRELSLRAAVRHFGQADPPQLAQARLLHHPVALGTVLVAAAVTRSRILWLVLGGLLFHVGLDMVDVSQTKHLKLRLSERAEHRCERCGRHQDVLQLHTVHVAGNPFDHYNPRHFAVLCPTCHQRAHEQT
jgi:hypothetical protein